jgi:predicted nucleic acid-binding Zn ribbon protein
MARKKNPRPLNNVLADLCGTIGMKDAYEQFRIVTVWEKVVGETIARVTKIEKIYNGDLYVKVRNPSWRMELNFRKKEITERINEETEKKTIKNIIFK